MSEHAFQPSTLVSLASAKQGTRVLVGDKTYVKDAPKSARPWSHIGSGHFLSNRQFWMLVQKREDGHTAAK